jgi:hypothetical protein
MSSSERIFVAPGPPAMWDWKVWFQNAGIVRIAPAGRQIG